MSVYLLYYGNSYYKLLHLLGSFPKTTCDTTSIAEFDLKVCACELGTLSSVAIYNNTFKEYLAIEIFVDFSAMVILKQEE